MGCPMHIQVKKTLCASRVSSLPTQEYPAIKKPSAAENNTQTPPYEACDPIPPNANTCRHRDRGSPALRPVRARSRPWLRPQWPATAPHQPNHNPLAGPSLLTHHQPPQQHSPSPFSKRTPTWAPTQTRGRTRTRTWNRTEAQAGTSSPPPSPLPPPRPSRPPGSAAPGEGCGPAP